MTVSVAIPAYNRAHKILGTIDSILSQTEAVDEIVICDDGSEDNLYELISGYSPLIKVVRIENSGPANARRVAIENCSSKWIALCDSDDYWLSNHIELFKEAAIKGAFELYIANFYHNKESASKLDLSTNHTVKNLMNTKFHSFPSGALLKVLLEYQFCFPSCMIFTKFSYDKIGGIDKKYSRWLSEDLHLTLRMAKKLTSCVCSLPTVSITKDDDNFSGDFLKTLAGEVDILNVLIDSTDFDNEDIIMIGIEIQKRRGDLFNQYYWGDQMKNALSCYESLPLSSKLLPANLRKAIVCYLKNFTA